MDFSIIIDLSGRPMLTKSSVWRAAADRSEVANTALGAVFKTNNDCRYLGEGNSRALIEQVPVASTRSLLARSREITRVNRDNPCPVSAKNSRNSGPRIDSFPVTSVEMYSCARPRDDKRLLRTTGRTDLQVHTTDCVTIREVRGSVDE